MAASSPLIPLTVCLFFLFHTCYSQLPYFPPSRRPLQRSQQQYYQCQLESINAREPSRKIQSEAGFTEIWDENDAQFRCAGVVALRHTIQPKGLLLPAYSNGPKMIYVEQGRGYHGATFSGCPETYESGESQSRETRRESLRDSHQKVRPIREGDLLALPVGTADWYYNNGQNPLVLVLIVDTSDASNQLDQNYRKFFLAGNPQRELQGQRPGAGSQQQTSGNVFSGLDDEIISQTFNIDQRLARSLKNENDNRGIIIRVERDLALLTPQETREQEEYDSRHGSREDNYAYETETGSGQINICTERLKVNVNDPSRADVYNPRAGRITNVNSLSFPILRRLQFSAQRGVLYQNAMVGPNWNLNAHSICYITRGSGRIQIVGDNGQTVYDGEVRRGQIITAPQNFVAVKKAGSKGLEWISFKTADHAQISQLAGVLSILRSMPVEVVANVYGISREDARKIKYNRDEAVVLSPTRSPR